MTSRFIIDSTDLTGQVNYKTSYKINSTPVYTSIKDANGVEYRNNYRNRISGSFEMWFITNQGVSYSNFLTLVSSNSVNGVLTCSVYVQNEEAVKVINCFIEISVKKEVDVNGYNVKIVNVTIKEC